MAQTVKVILTCDLPHDDPSDEMVTTVEFGYEGDTYSIELCGDHLDEYHNWMQDYVSHARSGGGSGRRPRAATKKSAARRAPGTGATTGGDLGAIRAWARENGQTVSDRGRISQAIRDAYAAAH